jgi:RNA polymerase sigma factor (sigma-70 family)
VHKVSLAPDSLVSHANDCAEIKAWHGRIAPAGRSQAVLGGLPLDPSEATLSVSERGMEPTTLLGIRVAVQSRKADTSGNPRPNAMGSDFAEFYQREFPQATRFAWLLVRSSASAEDLAQEAFVALSRCFDEVDNPRGFVHRVVINQARTWQRNEHRNRLKVLRASQERGTLSAADAELFDLVGALPYRQRVVVVTRYWLGWSEAEIADTLGCRPGTVKSLASRALDRLRKEIAGDDERA